MPSIFDKTHFSISYWIIFAISFLFILAFDIFFLRNLATVNNQSLTSKKREIRSSAKHPAILNKGKCCSLFHKALHFFLLEKNKHIASIMLWFVFALLFFISLFLLHSKQHSLEFITGYIVELSLSVDNLFVFILIFKYTKIPQKYQHRVLLWGIISAVILRLFMITFGIYLIKNFDWISYIFGIILTYSSLKILYSQIKEKNKSKIKQNKTKLNKPTQNKTLLCNDIEKEEDGLFIKLCKKYLPITRDFVEDKFFITRNNKLYFTPMFLALILIEKADIVFALDSIPAIISLTNEPYIIFTSNILAIACLRSLYFTISILLQKIKYLQYGLSLILLFIGIKMILTTQYFNIHISTIYSLLFIIFTLTFTFLISHFSQTKAQQKNNTDNI